MGTLNNNTTRSQLTEIRKYLLKYRKITSMEAIQLFGCTRLSARISDLRSEGMDIITDYGECISRYGHRMRFAVYRLRGVQK
jgi:hypothetical protein